MNPQLFTQGSDDWLQYRLGRCTGSRVKDALDFKKDGSPSQKRIDYMTELLAERFTGLVADHYVSPEMRFGTDNEMLARAAYEEREDVEVRKVGAFQHPRMEMFSASPDGLIGDDGLLEVKCPKSATHLKWLRAKVLPEEHVAQCLSELACSGRAWLDFVSFDPRLPAGMNYFSTRIYSNPQGLALLEEGVQRFLDDVAAEERFYLENYPMPALPSATHDADLGELGLTDEDLAYLDAPAEEA